MNKQFQIGDRVRIKKSWTTEILGGAGQEAKITGISKPDVYRIQLISGGMTLYHGGIHASYLEAVPNTNKE